MESVIYENSKSHFLTKKKIAVISIAILGSFLMVSEPVYASIPWYISIIGGITGGILGSLTGSPLGTIAGATAGVMIADYLYNALHKTDSLEGYNSNQLYANEFGSSYENLTTQEMINTEHSDNTAIELLSEDYYYNAQAEEAISLYYLNQSSLNCFNVSLASGSYATLNNVSLSLYSPVDSVLWQTWYTGKTSNNNYFNTSGFVSDGVEGSVLTSGQYIFIQPQNLSTEIYRCNSGTDYINLQNFYTGKVYNLTSNGVFPFNTHSIPNGLYQIKSVSGRIKTAGIQILPSGALNTTYSITLQTCSASTSDTFYNSFRADCSIFESFSTRSGITPYEGGNCGSLYYASPSFSGLPDYYSDLQSDLNKYFTSASTYFSSLKELGFTNINQLPSNDIIPFPSDVIPNSLITGNFTLQELQSIYFAYLNDLNNTFSNSTIFNGHNYTKYFNQTQFVNGFITVYGNLTWQTGTSVHYLNDTDFFIQTYSEKLYFQVHHTTELTGEQFPVLVLNGSENGTLLYVDASIYVISLELAGKPISSYTLQPEQISYVLPNTVSISPLSPIFTFSNFLNRYYIAIAIIIAVGLIAFVYAESKKDKTGKKE